MLSLLQIFQGGKKPSVKELLRKEKTNKRRALDENFINFYILKCLYFRSVYLKIGEGTGNPLQYSCLENLMDGEA